MAFSLDETVDFSTAVGYTFNGAEFGIAAGVGTLDAGILGPTTCVCPSINTTTWETINRVAVDETVSGSYRHRYLVSFDGGSTFYRWREGVWIPTDLSLIATAGLYRSQLEGIRNWPLLSSGLVFAVSASRSNAAHTGQVSKFSVYYSTSTTPQDAIVTGGEPLAAPTESLEDVLSEQPEMPLSPSYEWPFSLVELGGNYQVRAPRQSGNHRTIFDSVVFIAANSTRRDAILAFLASHYAEPFEWELCPFEPSKAFLASEPSISEPTVGVYRIATRFVEAVTS